MAASAVAALALAAALALLTGGASQPARPTAHARATPAAVAPARGAVPPVTMVGGKTLQSARCRQWRHATASQRHAIASTLAVVVGGPTPYGRANFLPDDEALALFDRACAHHYARGFLLYELYTRASGFYNGPAHKL